jgi:hypothetical protein
MLLAHATDNSLRFTRHNVYKQQQPAYWVCSLPTETFIISFYTRANRRAGPTLIQRSVMALLTELPMEIDESAISFADGYVYITTTDTLIPASKFPRCCHRFVDQPIASALQGDSITTPALDLLLAANNIPHDLICTKLGALLQPRWNSLGDHVKSVLCLRVQGCEEHALVDSLLACMVPKISGVFYCTQLGC